MSMVDPAIAEDTNTIKSVWQWMDQSKGDLIERSKEYARLTIPYICPYDDMGNTEQEHANVMDGPRVVNFLAHKLIGTLFPHDRPFFKVELKPEIEFKLSQDVEQAEIDQTKVGIAERGLQITRFAVKKLNMVYYRPVAIEAAKHLIVTGNVVLRRMNSGKRVNYGVQDFGVLRQIDGTPYDLIVRDCSRFDALEPDVQSYVRSQRHGILPSTPVALYSRWRKKGERWEFTQAVDEVNLPTFSMVTEKDFPCIIMTWTLARGEHYGRGLVEDNIAAFSGIDVSTTALMDLFGIAADVKFLVNPGSVLDLLEYASSKRGTFHYGQEGDVTSPNIANQKGADMQAMAGTVAGWERKLSAAFLMSSGSIRDAERVTAEEIRFYAKEIESAYGGLYSLLSAVWQQKEAEWAVRQVQAQIPEILDVVVITGMDALSQENALDSLRMSLNDLGLLNAVPEDVRSTLSVDRIARFIFLNRNLPFDQFTLSKAEVEARDAKLAQQQQQMTDMQTKQNVQTAVAQSAAKQ